MVLKLLGQSAFFGLAVLVGLIYNPPPYSFAPSIFLNDPMFAPVSTERRLIEVKAPGIIPRKSVHESRRRA